MRIGLSVGRLIFLEGTPVVSKLNLISIGTNAKEIILHDYEGELAAVRKYNNPMKLASEVGDNATHDLLVKIWETQHRSTNVEPKIIDLLTTHAQLRTILM